ncbi:MAG: hypothetical protein AAF389_09065 [Gemmatimonadota bacterium]
MSKAWPYVFVVFVLGCGDPPDQRFSVRSGVTACETEEWARERAELLEDDPSGADRFAADRCFVVETSVDIVVTSQPFMAGLRGENRWVQIGADGGGPVEHLASVALRSTLGLPAREAGWLRRSELTERP